MGESFEVAARTPGERRLMIPLRFANLTFRGTRREEILRDDGLYRLIVTVNAEIIVQANREPHLAEIINNNWATLDGQWPFWAAKLKSGRRNLEKISGSDFVYELCAMAAARGLSVFLLGATPEVNSKACQRLRERFGLKIDGYSPPPMEYPFPAAVNADILSRVREFRPAVVAIGLGCPKQELWADAHRQELESMGVRWAIGAGGTLDFIAGRIRRAPVFLQRAGLESLWRVALEPRLRFSRLLRAVRFLQHA